jgi:hypothetical protein
MYFFHMAFIHVFNGLNGGIIKWREPELIWSGCVDGIK